jgi:hypothetical protein
MQQQLHQVSLAASQKAAAPDAHDGSETTAGEASALRAAAADLVPKPAFSCNTCAGSFADSAEHRAHFKCPHPPPLASPPRLYLMLSSSFSLQI